MSRRLVHQHPLDRVSVYADLKRFGAISRQQWSQTHKKGFICALNSACPFCEPSFMGAPVHTLRLFWRIPIHVLAIASKGAMQFASLPH